jgi:hypothetical protein
MRKDILQPTLEMQILNEAKQLNNLPEDQKNQVVSIIKKLSSLENKSAIIASSEAIRAILCGE